MGLVCIGPSCYIAGVFRLQFSYMCGVCVCVCVCVWLSSRQQGGVLPSALCPSDSLMRAKSFVLHDHSVHIII